MRLKALSKFAVLALAACSPSAGPASIVVGNSRTYQTVISWEATSTLGDDDIPQEIVNAYREEVIQFAVDSVGLNGLRLPLRSGVESSVDLAPQFLSDVATRPQWRATWYAAENDNEDPFLIDSAAFQFTWLDHLIENVVLPMRERLAARGEELYLNLNYVDFGQSTFEHLAEPEEYAELLLAAFLHMQSKYGLTPDAVEVLLEPDVGQGWGPEALATAVVAAGDRLKANGFQPVFIAPSNTSMAAAVEYFDRMVAHPRVLEYVSVLSYHRYRDVSTEALREIAERVERYGIRSGMLEHISSDHESLHADLGLGQVSMWQQFVLGWPGGDDDGAAYVRVLDVESGNPRVVAASRTTFLSHYFRSARRGAVRIEATSDNANVAPLAFANTDGTVAVVVKSVSRTELTIEGLPAGAYMAYYGTIRGRSGSAGPFHTDGAGPLALSLPGAGVLSLRVVGSD